jgi:hypothetical protein
MTMSRDELLALFNAGVQRGRDEAVEDEEQKAANTAEEEFNRTLRYMLLDRTHYNDLERRNEIWEDMTNEQVIAAVLGE